MLQKETDTKKKTITKGQLISKCLFGAIVSTKKPTNFFMNFGPRGQIKKIKALYYSNQGLFNIFGIIKVFDSTSI